MPEAVIIDAIRTPIGALGGVLAPVRPDDLAAHILRALLQRTGIDPALVEEVYLGCANQAGEDNRNVARMATLLAGLPVEVAGVTVNRLCASGLAAVNLAARAIRGGRRRGLHRRRGGEHVARALLAAQGRGRLPLRQPDRLGHRPGLALPQPPDGRELYGTESMGETAENIAEQTGIPREAQDAFALESHRRAIAAIDAGRFAEEIMPGASPAAQGRRRSWSATDERPRRDTTLEALARLKPAFRKDGTVTAGNSSGLNDGAAALLVMSAERARQLGLKPLARIVASAAAGVDAAHHGPGARPGGAQGPGPRRPGDWQTSGWSSSTRPSPCSPWR